MAASGAQLLGRIAGESSAHGPLLVPLRTLFAGFSRAFWEESIRTVPVRLSPDHCRVIGPGQVTHYRLTGDEGWAGYGEIRQAFRQRNQQRAQGESVRGAKTSPLSPELVDAPVKLVIRDQDNPIRCAVVWDRVYPRRAWVGTLHPSVGHEMAFVVAGILNSALGQLLYRRLARAQGHESHDVRKRTLGDLRIPLLGYDPETFSRAALLSYRLHCLYAAAQECGLSMEIVDVDIRNHWLQLLSEVVRLYGYSEPEADRLVERVLPAGLKEVPGFQGELFYRPKEPLQKLTLVNRTGRERYEARKAEARARTLTPDGKADLNRLQRMLGWELQLNDPIPHYLAPKPWPGVRSEDAAIRAAETFLSAKKGRPSG